MLKYMQLCWCTIIEACLLSPSLPNIEAQLCWCTVIKACSLFLLPPAKYRSTAVLMLCWMRCSTTWTFWRETTSVWPTRRKTSPWVIGFYFKRPMSSEKSFGFYFQGFATNSRLLLRLLLMGGGGGWVGRWGLSLVAGLLKERETSVVK
jgi:hypothetical protein